MTGFIGKVTNKFNKIRTIKQLAVLVFEVKTIISILKDWINGNYRDISKKTIFVLTGALIYFLSPFDFVFDGILAIHLVSYLLLWALCCKFCRNQKNVVNSFFSGVFLTVTTATIWTATIAEPAPQSARRAAKCSRRPCWISTRSTA